MKRSRIVAAAVLSLVLVSGPVVAPALVPVPSASAAEGLPYIPSPNKWRQYMINILSSVLGAATPNKWKAEQIANVYKYDGGFETLNQKFGIDGIRMNEAGQITGVKYSNMGTGTYTDVVIAGLEDSYKGQSAKGRGPVRAPATPFKTFVRVAGTAGLAIGAYEVSALIGGAGANLVGGWMGVDPNAIVCAASRQDGADAVSNWIFRTMAGQDCSAFDLNSQYIPNADQAGSVSYGGKTMTYWKAWLNGSGQTVHCVKMSATGQWPSTASGAKLQLNYGAGWGLANSPFGAITPINGGGATCAPNTGVIYFFFSAGAGGSAPIFRVVDGSGAVVGDWVIGNPDRRLKCTVTNTDGTMFSGFSDYYTETTGQMAEPECPNPEVGKTPDSVKIQEEVGGVLAPDPIFNEQTTDEYQDWWEQYPECQYGACELDLIRLAPVPAVSCFDLDAGCPDWWEDPDKTSKYLCRYGVHDVPLSECNVYSGVFKPGRVTAGSPYSDPTTGEWSGGQNAPSERNANMQRTLQDPGNIRSCDFQDVGFDPVGWILRGGQCLAEWTFVARPTVVDVHTAALEESWVDTGPGELAAAVGAWSFVPPGGGCGGLTIPWSETLGHGIPDWNILNACPGSPLQPAAVASSVVLTLGAVLGLILALTRIFGGTVGFTGLGGGRGD